VAYGFDAYERRDPLAWPNFTTETDVKGLPPIIINVNECVGVPARCRQVMGTTHPVEVLSVACPEISRDAAADLARLARGKRAFIRQNTHIIPPSYGRR
jgi:acetyl esterase